MLFAVPEPAPTPAVVIEGDIVTFHMTCKDQEGNVSGLIAIFQPAMIVSKSCMPASCVHRGLVRMVCLANLEGICLHLQPPYGRDST